MKATILSKITILTVFPVFLFAGPIVSQNPREGKQIPEFKKSAQVFEAGATLDVVLEDFDADGDLDALISNFGQSLILANDGKGGFAEKWRFLTVHGGSAGDIDSDGDVDLVAPPAEPKVCRIYLNNGRGVFENANRDFSDPSIPFIFFIQLIDIDKDGDLDAVASNVAQGGIVFVNDGKGRFEKGGTTIPNDASFCDLNGDGFVDILARESELEFKLDPNREPARSPRRGERGFRVYVNDRKGNFQKYSFLPVSELVHGQFALNKFADIDNDGDQDVIYADNDFNRVHPVGILLNDGTGRLAEGPKLASVAAGRIGAGDLNNDGFVDLVITNWNQPAQVWLNNGTGKFFDSGLRLGERYACQGCAIKDLDGDGDQDIFITDYQQGRTVVWFNQLSEKRK